MTRVYVDMVADLFHFGHVEMLRRARLLGDELVVGLHSDEDCAAYKRPPVMKLHERAAVVQACRYVDEVLLNAPLVSDRDWIERNRLDIVVHGDDFSEEVARRYYAVSMDMGIFRFIPYTQGISTTEIIERLRHVDENVEE